MTSAPNNTTDFVAAAMRRRVVLGTLDTIGLHGASRTPNEFTPPLYGRRAR